MFCSKCGNKSPVGALFCHKCGNKMGNEAVSQTPIQAPPQLEIERPSLAVEYPVIPPEPSVNEMEQSSAPVINLNEYAFFPEPPAISKPPEQKKAPSDNSGYTYFPTPDKKKPKPNLEPLPMPKQVVKTSYPLPPKESWRAFADNPIFADTSPKPATPIEPEPVVLPPITPVTNVPNIPSFSEYYPKPVEPIQPIEQLPNMSKLSFPDSSSFPSYPQKPLIEEPIAEPWPQYIDPEPESWPTVSDNMDFAEFLSKPIMADKPLPEKTKPAESTDFADFFSQPAIKIDSGFPDLMEAPRLEPPAPLIFSSEPSFSDVTSNLDDYHAFKSDPKAPLPWFADNTDMEQTKPISRPQGSASYPTAPSFTTKSPDYDSELDQDFIEDMPKKRGSVAVFAGVTMLIVVIALGAFFFINREAASPSERLIGSWEQVRIMGTWVKHFEFNHDGTGNSYEYNAIHQITRYETSFEWEVAGRNLYITNYTGEIDTAQFEFAAISGRTVLRIRFNSDDDWIDYW